LQPLKKQTGLYSGMTGKQFEMSALQVMEEYVFPDLRAREPELADVPFVLLANLTMGTGFEIDQLVIVPSADPENQPCQVLALVEVKRNVNDVARSLIQLQTVLGWCSGARTKYDSQAQKTKTNPSGNFDLPIYHEEDGQRYMFTLESFRRFSVDSETNYIIDRVFYITLPRGNSRSPLVLFGGFHCVTFSGWSCFYSVALPELGRGEQAGLQTRRRLDNAERCRQHHGDPAGKRSPVYCEGCLRVPGPGRDSSVPEETRVGQAIRVRRPDQAGLLHRRATSKQSGYPQPRVSRFVSERENGEKRPQQDHLLNMSPNIFFSFSLAARCFSCKSFCSALRSGSEGLRAARASRSF